MNIRHDASPSGDVDDLQQHQHDNDDRNFQFDGGTSVFRNKTSCRFSTMTVSSATLTRPTSSGPARTVPDAPRWPVR
jgi:hypothetical protein